MFDWLPQRDQQKEIMDDLSMKGTILNDALKDIEQVNRWLGGYQIVRSALRREIFRLANRLDRPVRIADLGCGGGDTLRALARYFRKKELPVELVGMDANRHVLEYARQASRAFPEIRFRSCRILEEPVCPGADIVLCSLFLHHFEDKQIIELLRELRSDPQLSLIVVNDLHRHRLAYLLFQGWSRIWGLSDMARHDGLLSVRKSFRRSELEFYLRSANCPKYRLRWYWAFRWQLLLFNAHDACTS